MPEIKTTKPMSHVLVVSADPGWRDEVVAGINAAAQKLDNPFDLLAVPAIDAGAAISCVRADGDVQIVLIDHGDHTPAAKPGKGSARHQDVATMAQDIIALRPELSLYVTLEDDENKLLLESLASNVVHGYFYRGERDYNGWARILAAEIAEKSATPFYDELKDRKSVV